MDCVKSIMVHENELLDSTKQVDDPDLKLTNEEQEVLWYVAGYLVFLLQQKYLRIKHSGAAKSFATAALQLLKSLQMTGGKDLNAGTFLEFSKKYIEKKDRGALIKPNDEMFLFENRVRTILNINLMRRYKGEDLRDLIENELKKRMLIDTYLFL